MMSLSNLRKLVPDAIRTLKLPETKSEKPLVLFFVGPPASGKTHLARALLNLFPFVELSRENIASYLTPRVSFFQRGDEEVLELAQAVILELVKQKYNLIFDSNFKKRAGRLSLKEKVETLGGRVLVVQLTCPTKIALLRIDKQNQEIQKGKKRGFILDRDYFYYEVNTAQPPMLPENYIAFDSSGDAVKLRKFLARVRQKLAT